MKIKDKKITDYWVTVKEFKQFVGRNPVNKKEFEDFCHLCLKGIEAQIDWTMVMENAGEHFSEEL